MLVVLDNTSAVPLYQQIVEQIGSRILSGQLEAGDLLPSVRQLAADLVTSLITTRRAYQELEAAGLIETRAGRGTYVAQIGAKSRDRLRTAQIEESLTKVVRAAARTKMSRSRLVSLVERIAREEGLEDE